jgi:putative membrane protein
MPAMRFIARCIANSIGILLSALVIPGFIFTGDFKTLLAAGLVLGLANAVIRPILKLVSLPIILITFGLFTVVVNMLVLKLVDYFIDSLSISFGALFWATILISLVNGLGMSLISKHKKED